MTDQMKHRLGRLVGGVRDLLFPPRCVGCDELLPPFEGTIFCPMCRTAWEAARTRARHTQATATDSHPLYLVPYRSGHTTGVPERLIYNIKHQGDYRVFRFVAATLSPSVQNAFFRLCADVGTDDTTPPLVTYAPRRPAAVRADGFDQAARLAKALAKEIGGEYAPLLRRRKRLTSEQKHLNTEGRRKNATHAYALRRNAALRVPGRVIILCDDVSTTGATFSACEELLLSAGAVAVLRVSIACTEGTPPNKSPFKKKRSNAEQQNRQPM